MVWGVTFLALNEGGRSFGAVDFSVCGTFVGLSSTEMRPSKPDSTGFGFCSSFSFVSRSYSSSNRICSSSVNSKSLAKSSNEEILRYF